MDAPLDAPADVPPSGRFAQLPLRAHEPVRTFHPRRSPLSQAAKDALASHWPRLGFSVHDDADPPPLDDAGLLDLPRLFGRDAPLVLEIGAGMGEAVAAMAAADPDRSYLAVEAHVPGIASTLGKVARAGVTNVRVAHGDALDLARRLLRPDSLDAVHIFFPDPWPKQRHHKRRIVSPERVALLRSRLRPGGTLHCATDWEPYARQMLEVLAADPGLVNDHGGAAPRPAYRPVTKFERRGLELGHVVTDVIVRRRG